MDAVSDDDANSADVVQRKAQMSTLFFPHTRAAAAVGIIDQLAFCHWPLCSSVGEEKEANKTESRGGRETKGHHLLSSVCQKVCTGFHPDGGKLQPGDLQSL